AKSFLDDAKLKRDFIIVENCPLRFNEIPELNSQIADLKRKGNFIVIHRGPFGFGSQVDIYATLRSIKYYPDNSIFINVGLYKEDELQACLK
ncbi:hypothetical protein, partial [Caballeronia sp. NCTM5]|uniref:hypothetical protein n=1 Tax=Caballeronia sp. NCTM5 TaxID=2921755 RepID=UPI002028A196